MTHQRSLPGSVSALPKFLLFAGCVIVALGMFDAPASSQGVSFAGVQTTVGSGLSYPFSMVVDEGGDVFIADSGNSRVVEVPAGGGPQTTVSAIGLYYPTGVAVDGAGDIFIADPYNNRVVEVPAGGGPQTTVGSGLSYPYGVAVDRAGDVFIADSYNSRVVEVPAGGGPQTTVGSGLGVSYGVAVDGAGNVFIADNTNSRVVEVPTGGGPQTTVGSGLSGPYGVAVDGVGDVFIADEGNFRVVEVPVGGGPQTTVSVGGLYYPTGVAVDGAGDIFVADQNNNRVVEVQRVAVNLGNVNVCPAGQSTPVPCSQPLTLNYNVAATTTFGTTNIVTQGTANLDFTLSSSTCTGTVSAGSICTVIVSFAPLAPGARMGAVQLTDNSGNLLVTTMVHGIGQGPAIVFVPGVQTTVGSGLSFPTGVAVDGAGNVFIADIAIHYTELDRVVEVPAGGGPQITVGSGLGHPTGVAVDGAGDVFIAIPGGDQVVEVPAGGGPQTTVGVGLNVPYGVAVDGAGNVFIADSGNNRVVEVPAGGGPQTTVPAIGLNYPRGVAVDGAGDVFIADCYNNRVVEVPAGGGSQTTVGSGLSSPMGVAVDGAGDVFIAENGNSPGVVEVQAGGGPQTTVASGFNAFGVAVDGAGDVFIANPGPGSVVELRRSQPPTLSFASTPDGSTSSDSPQSITIQNVGNQRLNAVIPGLVVVSSDFLQVAGSGTPADCTTSFSLTPGETCNLSVSFTPQHIGNLAAAVTFTDNALNAIPPASQSIALQGTGQPATFNVTVGTSPAGLAFVVDVTTYVSAQGFTWTNGSSHTIATVSPQTPVAGTQYTFANWSDGGALSHSVTASVNTTAYTAMFSTQYMLTTSVSPVGGGTVSTPGGYLAARSSVPLVAPPLPSGYQVAGSSVPLVATPYAGYVFSNWTGNVANANNAATSVTMNAAETVTANFINTTTTALVSSLNPSTFGQSVTFTATVTPTGGSTPTGTVTFTDGSIVLGVISLSGGQAALSTSALAAGIHSIVASYVGDSNHQSSASTALLQPVQTASTTLGLASNLNPSVYNQAATFTASITPKFNGSATGTVTFFDVANASTLGTAPVSGNQATLTLSTLPVGTGEITAFYSGDSNVTGNVSHEVFQVVKKSSTTTSVKSSLNPALVGESITYMATVSSQYSGTTSGAVNFAAGGAALGSATLVNGQASISVSFSTFGNRSITVKYLGDVNNTLSTSPALKQVVNKYASSTSIVSSLNPSIVGQTVTFTATVLSSGSPTGTVTFKTGLTSLGTIALTGNTASVSTSTLTAGTHVITAVYSGDATVAASTAPGLKQVVKKW